MTRDRLQALKAARSGEDDSCDVTVDVDGNRFMEEFFEQNDNYVYTKSVLMLLNKFCNGIAAWLDVCAPSLSDNMRIVARGGKLIVFDVIILM
ncbi:hypothetical protein T4D_6497 [Trichinella pseudospiralis]|uniref:Uncharacterized protein n=1 Tax=Trichinella pseudospiralis TaxID=6337 RepID=A0A0V1G3V9_TRIPS|nr:hypothetical protein T4D_6497 [Trichinella pseudospiralis]